MKDRETHRPTDRQTDRLTERWDDLWGQLDGAWTGLEPKWLSWGQAESPASGFHCTTTTVETPHAGSTHTQQIPQTQDSMPLETEREKEREREREREKEFDF